MSNALRFVRLDFTTIKPYFTLKNLAIIIAAPMLILIVDGGSSLSIGFFLVFAAMYINYPFVIAERSGMDALYSTLSITRKTVVLGRYLFAVAFDLLAALVGVGLTALVTRFTQKNINTEELLITTVVVMAVVTFVEAIQLPLYFKLGYEKAKMLAYFPFIGLMAVGLAVNHFLPKPDEMPQWMTDTFLWFSAHQAVAIAIGGAVWLGMMAVSYRMSLKYYRKRDF